MTILFQDWPHDGTADRKCSKKCRTCNLTAEVQRVIDSYVNGERNRRLKLMKKVLARLGDLLSEENGECPVTEAVRDEIKRLTRK